MARSTLALVVAGLLWFAAGLTAQENTSDRALQQAGVCSRCHVAQVLEWSASRHTKANTVCQTCHGPSTAHVANERNEVKPDRRPQGAAIATLCATCHTGGCPKTRESANCQSCHHPHALVNPTPGKLVPMEDPTAARREEVARRLAAGDRLAASANWKGALAEFNAALRADPDNRRAKLRARMCERRLNPSFAGFEVLSAAGFDPESGLPRRVTVAGLGIEMVLIPAGEIDIGSESLTASKPVHTVRVSPFYLGAREVTQAEWSKVASENPSLHRGDVLPVNNVSWHDAQKWIGGLNSRVAGAGFRLPTEAEWEYAARSNALRGSLGELAWFRENSLRNGLPAQPFYESDAYAPRPAGSKKPTSPGLFDLRGNVWEWCSSLFRPYPYDEGDGREAPSDPGLRVLRGGGYADGPADLDPALRHSERPDRRQPWNGFRLARSAPE
jgi:formylglycine-generating enzyme required for sulfatase activity